MIENITEFRAKGRRNSYGWAGPRRLPIYSGWCEQQKTPKAWWIPAAVRARRHSCI